MIPVPFQSFRSVLPRGSGGRTGSSRLLMMVVLALLPAWPLSAAGAGDAVQCVIGFSSGTFMNTDRETAQGVTRLWTSQLARKGGVTAETRLLASVSDIEREVRSKRIDLLILLSSEYLALKDKVPLEPLFVSSNKDGINIRLALIVRKDSGIRTVMELKGKQLILQKGLYVDGQNLWLDTLLMRNGVVRTESFFSLPPRYVTKASMALMPVFFRRAHACIVSTHSLKLMGELNPQLLRELVILAESPPLPAAVIAVRRGLPVSFRNQIHEVLYSLDKTPQGQQLLTLFHMSSLTPYRPEYMKTLEEQFKEYNYLKKHPSRRGHDTAPKSRDQSG